MEKYTQQVQVYTIKTREYLTEKDLKEIEALMEKSMEIQTELRLQKSCKEISTEQYDKKVQVLFTSLNLLESILPKNDKEKESILDNLMREIDMDSLRMELDDLKKNFWSRFVHKKRIAFLEAKKKENSFLLEVKSAQKRTRKAKVNDKVLNEKIKKEYKIREKCFVEKLKKDEAGKKIHERTNAMSLEFVNQLTIVNARGA